VLKINYQNVQTLLQGAEVQRTAFITKELKPDSRPSAAALAADAENADFKAKPPMVSFALSAVQLHDDRLACDPLC
jgi:hypothetical protein